MLINSHTIEKKGGIMTTTKANYDTLIVKDPVLFTQYLTSYIALINSSVEDNSILGFIKPISNDNYNVYIENKKYELKNNSLELIFIFDDHKLIGTVSLKYFRGSSKSHICEIHKGIIKKENRGINVLKKIFQAIEIQALKNNISKIILDVRENSRAHKMWKYIGFTEYGKLLDYSRIDNMTYSGCFMEISLDTLSKFTRRK